MGYEYQCPRCGVLHGQEYSYGCLPSDSLCDDCADYIFEQEIKNKLLDEIIAKWKWWFDEGFERPIQKETVVELFESLRQKDSDYNGS